MTKKTAITSGPWPTCPECHESEPNHERGCKRAAVILAAETVTRKTSVGQAK